MKPLAIYTTPLDAVCTLVHDDGPTFVAVDGIGANGRPGHIFSIDGVGDGHGAKLTVEKVGFATVNQRGTLWLSRPSTFAEFDVDDVILNPRQAAPPLHVNGQFFALADGTRWTAIECSDFALLNIFQHQGASVAEPIATQRRDLGFNLCRVWTRYTAGTGAGQFLDINYATVGAFLNFMSDVGLYVDLTGYTGRDAFEPGHWGAICQAVQGHTNVLLSLCNENDQPNNHIDLTPFQPCPGVLCSRGSNGSQAWPPIAAGWVWAEMHYNDAPEWQRKTGHNSMEVADAYGMPVIANENTRYIDRDASLPHAQGAAESAALLCAGSCFHSTQGKTSSLFTGVTLDAAKMWAASAKKVDLTFQQGAYHHAMELETPGILRAYQRILPDHRAYTALVPV